MPASSSSAPARHAYHPALDGLRAVAVLLVLSEHLKAFVFPQSSALPPGGYLGVDLFFVLSGYLITSLLLAERREHGRVSFRAFYRRRIFRLFPALAAFVVAQAGAAYAAGQSLGDEVHFWLGALTYTGNWVMAAGWSVPANTGHLWSLAVEEQFYLVWPIVLVLVCRRLGTRHLGAVAAIGIAIALLTRAYLTNRWGLGSYYPNVYLQTECRLDALLCGAALAWAQQVGWRPSRSTTHLLGWAGLATVTWFVLESSAVDWFMYARGGYTVLAIAAVGVVLAALDPTWAPSRLLSRPTMVAIGKMSYSLYLWHMLALFVLLGHLQRQSVAVAAIELTAASFVLAYVSYRFVESPLRSLGRATPADRAQRVHRPRPVARARRAPWVLAGTGVCGLVGLSALPAYASRHEIIARDEMVAAVAAQLADHRTPTPSADAAAPTTTTTATTTVPEVASAPTPTTIAVPPPDGTSLIMSILTVEAPAVTNTVGPPPEAAIALSATLTDSAGTALSSRLVQFDTRVGSCTGATDGAGRATCSLPVAPDTSSAPQVTTVHATYYGDARTAPAAGAWP